MSMKKFNEEIKAYALDNGFKEITEVDITKSEFKEKVLSNPFYSLLFCKEVKDHLFYILVPKEIAPDETFSLRVYNKNSEFAARGEYRMRISEFLKYNEAFKVDKNPRADIIGQTFDKVYSDVLNYKGEPSE